MKLQFIHKIAFCINHSFNATLEPQTGRHNLGFLYGLEFLLDPFDQVVLHVAWNLVSASFNCAPHQKVHQIQVWRVRRPNMRQDKINKVFAQPKLHFS